MNPRWPSPVVFVVAAVLFARGCNAEDAAMEQLSQHPVRYAPVALTGGRLLTEPDIVRDRAEFDRQLGVETQIAGGAVAVVGVALFGLHWVRRVTTGSKAPDGARPPAGS